MTNEDEVWVVLHDRDDDLAAGPFGTAAEADSYVDGFDDVYPARVARSWFEWRTVR